MTDLEELEETSMLPTSLGSPPRHRLRDEFCGGGHLWADNTRWYRYRGRMRRMCRACDKERGKKRRLQCSPTV